MVYYIENQHLKVGVKLHGCELTSVYSKDASYEYLWQGDTNIWYGQSPILFPIIGRLINDTYTLNGKDYKINKHGFARNYDWKLLSQKEDTLSMIFSDNEDTIQIYPYHFDLIVTYTVKDKTLTVTHTVVNKNDTVMYFSLGAHPGFNCEIGDKLVFDENETLSTEKIHLTEALRLPETLPVLNNEKEITITKDIFAEDALILNSIKSKCITLKSDNHPRTVKFNMGNSPYLGIWAKPGAPYVCIEPWFGVNDSYEKKDDFSQKDGINKLEAQEKFNFTWKAEFSH